MYAIQSGLDKTKCTFSVRQGKTRQDVTRPCQPREKPDNVGKTRQGMEVKAGRGNTS